jgi:hypothetical protein
LAVGIARNKQRVTLSTSGIEGIKWTFGADLIIHSAEHPTLHGVHRRFRNARTAKAFEETFRKSGGRTTTTVVERG